VPDWLQLVRERLGALGIGVQREEEVVAELAGYLEDAYEGRLKRGATPERALACAFSEVANWARFRKEIRRAASEEGSMSVHTKNLVLPGITMLISAASLLLAILWLVPPAVWADRRAPVLFFALWLLSYCVMGALGAYWSRREGGNTATRFLSGVFPLAMHLGIVLCVIFATAVGASRSPEHHEADFMLRAGLTFVVAPGVALAIGTLPFLRKHAKDLGPAVAK
jgi:hypothetical protein